MIKKFKLRTKLSTFAVAMALTSLTGCEKKELAPTEHYDVIETDESLLNNLIQTIDVPNENFKLVAEFSCDDSSKREWRITSDKYLYIKINTQNLDDNTEVYIDNIHIDTSIKSKYAIIDGIMQDTMDDRVHNSLMIGFPISNDTYYYGVNAIEGCNKDFIQGTFYGYEGYSSGTVEQKRYTESDYIELGVYANKISVVVDLLVKGPNDKDYRNISVYTDFLVNTSTKEIEYEDNNTKEKTKKSIK